MSLKDMLDKSMSVLVYTKTSDAFGGYTATSAASVSGVPCTLQPLSGAERAAYRGEHVDEAYKLFFEAGTTLTADDEIKIGTLFFEVQSVLDDGGRSHHWKAMVRRMNPRVR